MFKSHIAGFALLTLSFACFAEPDITSPGPELPTSPENVNTLLTGNGYLEISLFGYVGNAKTLNRFAYFSNGLIGIVKDL